MIKLSYLLLFIALWTIIMFVYNGLLQKHSVVPKTRLKRITTASLVLFAWLGIQFALSESGFYLPLDMPPRIPLLMILPLMLFIVTFLRKHKNNPLLLTLPIYVPIAYQSFRLIIELMFHQTYEAGILPVNVTFEGANYDILIGITAIPMGIYAYRKSASKRLLLIWNYLGIAVVAFAAFTFISSFYFPSVWGAGTKHISLEFNQFPYLILPTFFMPSAIFMHILSIIQLNKKRKLEA